jgi:predicted component of type VI protein secretion system
MAGDSLRITLRGPDSAERELSFEREVVRVGRARDCDLPLESGYVSRYHARLEMHNNSWTVADEGSKNGVYVNGQRITGAWGLHPGDSVRVGDYTLIIDPLQIDYDRTLAIPFMDQQAQAGTARPESAPPATAQPEPEPGPPLVAEAVFDGRDVVEPAPEPTVASAEPMESAASGADAAEVAQPESPPIVERVRIDTAGRRVLVEGRDVSGAVGARGFLLFEALNDAADGREVADLLDAVWGPGAADADMLDRLVDRMQRSLTPDATSRPLIDERPDGGYRLAIA